MKKTYLQIAEADQLVASLYAKNSTIEKGKFGYAWKRFIEKNYNPIAKELNEKLADNRIENCLTDEKTKEILYTPEGNYKFSKEGMKAVVDFSRKIIHEYNLKEFEIIPFIVKQENLPELSEEEKDLLMGLVI